MENSQGFVHFLGTAGSRYTTMRQLRASGGIWLNFKDTNILIDPGPGSLVRILENSNLDPKELDAIVLTHKHLDHSNDINIMTEVMTHGGKVDRGILIVPHDAVGEGGVVFDYAYNLPEKIELIHGGEKITLKDCELEFSQDLRHGVPSFAITFICDEHRLVLVPDTDYFEGLEDYFQGDMAIINVLTPEHREHIDHLCLEEAELLIKKMGAKDVMLTHFGIPMLEADMHNLAKQISKDTAAKVVCAEDGMRVQF